MAAPTSIDITVDLEEYSRFESERDTVVSTIVVDGASLQNEDIILEFRKARRSRDEIVATQTLTLTNNDPDEYQVSWDLTTLVDEEEVPKVRRGEYFIRATSDTDPGVTDDSDDFKVSIISVERIKADYLHGTDSLASDVLGVIEQPSVVTGITVETVSKGHPLSFHELSYNRSTDSSGNNIHLLSWCGGPTASLSAAKKTYILKRGSSADYIKVRMSALADLPSESTSEEIGIERKPLTDARIQGIIDQSISWVEDVALAVYVEPCTIVTETDPDTVAFASGTGIPSFVGATWDKVVDALTYYNATPGHWINIKFPYYPLIRIDELYGKVSNTRVVDIALEWIERHERGGFVELVPFNQEAIFNFIGLVWVESLRGPTPIPNFWNFEALVGFRKTPAVIIELIAKKAAIDILTIAGQAFRGGYASQSISRDGVSESVSYTASATFGIYSASIEDYRKWIEKNLKELRGAFRGPNMVVL